VRPDQATHRWISTYLATLASSGIIYALTVEETRRLAGFLRQEGNHVTAYSGQTETDDREEIEAALLTNQLRAVVATSALGMGFDKPDLSLVIHLGAPSSPTRTTSRSAGPAEAWSAQTRSYSRPESRTSGSGSTS
jgi:ATP-dependent DNA helicase RecQ